MDKRINFSLLKYRGTSSKSICPHCGQKSFKPYVDEDQQPFSTYFIGTQHEELAKTVGRCDHDSSCGYHYPPKDFFKDTNAGKLNHDDSYTPPPPPKESPPIQFDLVERSMPHEAKNESVLVKYWRNTLRFPQDALNQALLDYKVGATRAGRIIYWMIDLNGNAKDGKMMEYTADGHRNKANRFAVNWIWSTLINTNKDLSDDAKKEMKKWHVTRPYFGTHLLADHRYINKPVALVEGEKSALIGSVFMPQYIWIAIGTKNWNLYQLQPIIKQGRKMFLFPDLDGINDWRERIPDLHYSNGILCDEWIIQNAETENDDIGDILMRMWARKMQVVDMPSEQVAEVLKATFPDSDHDAIDILCDKLDLAFDISN